MGQALKLDHYERQIMHSMRECSVSSDGVWVCMSGKYVVRLVSLNRHYHQAVSTQAPPTALILRSAILLKNLALTTTGWAGRNPLPSTLK